MQHSQQKIRGFANAVKQVAVNKIEGTSTRKGTGILYGLNGSDIVAPLRYSGTMDGVLFNYWFQYILLPSLVAGSVIVMDNARFHQKKLLSKKWLSVGTPELFV